MSNNLFKLLFAVLKRMDVDELREAYTCLEVEINTRLVPFSKEVLELGGKVVNITIEPEEAMGLSSLYYPVITELAYGPMGTLLIKWDNGDWDCQEVLSLYEKMQLLKALEENK